MQLIHSRGISRHSQRDFAQERADLDEGYNNYKQATQASINDLMVSAEYSADQKKNILYAYKAELLQKEQEYQEELRKINEAERWHWSEEPGEGICNHSSQDVAEEYCGWVGQSEPELEQSVDEYCGLATQEETKKDYSVDNGY